MVLYLEHDAAPFVWAAALRRGCTVNVTAAAERIPCDGPMSVTLGAACASGFRK